MAAVTQLLSVVMCGGKSTRMGTDKGLIPVGDTTWAGVMVNKLLALHIPVKVSINPAQAGNYGLIFDNDKLITDALAIAGPLNGILSVHLQYPDRDLLLLACDMINMEAITLQQLMGSYTDKPGYDFYAYRNEAFAEPFCAVYTSAGLRDLREKYNVKQLSGMSLQKVLQQGNTLYLPVTQPESFKNFNTPA
ncbi:molybdenum cofactor guanylyltransferase [Mucilaginibacter sp. AW1-3]